jgi:hypothetical protein
MREHGDEITALFDVSRGRPFRLHVPAHPTPRAQAKRIVAEAYPAEVLRADDDMDPEGQTPDLDLRCGGVGP